MLEKRVLGVSLLLHLLIPLFSIGFLHPDEQYYALDYAFFKHNLISNYQFTWEYHEQIRPWSLPFLFYIIMAPLKFLGIQNPFILALICRVVSSLFAFLGIYSLIQISRKIFSSKLNDKNLIIFLGLSWPLLLMHARTSSENWASMTFIFAITFLLKEKKWASFFSGLLVGLTFFLRFQMALLIGPLLIFAFIKYRKLLWPLILGVMISCAVMICVDFWGYGELAITPWNYFRVNLIEGKVNHFGISPWYYYFKKALLKLIPFWGIGIFWCLKDELINWKENKKFKYLLLSLLPFFAIHQIIGHKELRFLFPLLPFLLIIMASEKAARYQKWTKVIIGTNALVIPFLFFPIYKPMLIYQDLWQKKEIKTLYKMNDNKILEMDVYKRSDMEIEKHQDFGPGHYLTQNITDFELLNKKRQCQIISSTYPRWVMAFNYFNWLKRSSVWILSNCR